eukprot:gene11411-biopygen8308
MTTQWLDKLDHVQQCYSRLAKLPLSMFGRGLSSSAYGISKLLYHAEFEGIPLGVVEQLSCLTTKLVDRGLAPESTALKLPGVPSALLPAGSPKLGGFGCIPWQHHITSRHAVWGVRFFRGLAREIHDRSPPWLIVAHELLLTLMPPDMASQPPALGFLHACRDTTRFQTSACGQGLPHGPLRHMALGIAALSTAAGPSRDVSHRPLELGPWCLASPLWGNPLLPAPPPPPQDATHNAPLSGIPGTFLDDVFYPLMQIPSLA